MENITKSKLSETDDCYYNMEYDARQKMDDLNKQFGLGVNH